MTANIYTCMNLNCAELKETRATIMTIIICYHSFKKLWHYIAIRGKKNHALGNNVTQS
jgi:hypothetical protein